MSNTTVPIFGGGPEIIQDGDFFQSAGILHPLIIGTIAIAILFAYLRLSSNRSVAPMTVFDWIISVAIGSTLAGVVNGTALVRGAIAMAVLLFWQFATSYLAMKFPGKATTVLTSPALIIAYRGRALKEVMSAHRISGSDLSSALRCAGVWHIKEVEVVIIEPTGKFNVYLRKCYPKDYEPEVLLQLDAYRALVEHDDEHEGPNGKNCCGKDGEDAVKEVC